MTHADGIPHVEVIHARGTYTWRGHTLKKGSGGCVRAMVSSRPSQNQKRKASKTEKGKTVCNCLGAEC